MTMMKVAVDVIILAAGSGSRMRAAAPKPLVPLGGAAMVGYVLSAAAALKPRNVVMVIPAAKHAPSAAKMLRAVSHPKLPKIVFVEQAQPNGTADAAQCGLSALPKPKSKGGGAALIICADSPLMRAETLRRLCAAAGGNALALLTADMPQPKGYGRIVRDDNNRVRAIVEEKDADTKTKLIGEIYGGALAAPLEWLRGKVPTIKADNKAGERYLTDLAKIAAADDNLAVKCISGGAEEAFGVNTPADLARAESYLRARRVAALMRAGLRFADPLRADIRGEVRGGADSFVDINVIFSGRVSVGQGCIIGANCVIHNCTIKDGARIEPFCHLHSAVIGRGCVVGPFARLRPHTTMADGANVGSFVEVKNSTLRANAKAGHLAYIGDAVVGQNANIGAGAITCNYDGREKHATIIGDGAFVGSGVELVAPVKIGEGAYIAAGSTITRDAKAGALTVARCRQKTRRLPKGAKSAQQTQQNKKTGGLS